MGNLSKKNAVAIDEYVPEAPGTNGIEYILKALSREFKNDAQQDRRPSLDDLLTMLTVPAGKKSFLVYKNHKYFTVPTETISFFYVKYESSMIMSFDRQEYSVNYSLEEIQNLLTAGQFFRLNRQYLVNFHAIKEVEHYFARKLLVRLAVPAPDKLLVPKEKVSSFLYWLENR